MNNSVSDSLNKIRLIESPTTAAAPVAQTAGSKILGKVIPGAGAALGAYDAANRLKAGDKTGAAIAGITGAASMIPGIGTKAALLGTGIQAARDKWRTGSWLPDDEQIAAAATGQPAQAAAAPAAPAQPAAQVPPGGDPKVFALQQQLIAKGAKIKADGKMGPGTQAAMKQFPGVQLSSKINKSKGTYMSESDKIAALRARLEQIDNPQLNENPLSALAKFGQGVAKGVANPAATNLKNVAAGTTAGAKGIKTGAAVARNPGKVALGGAAAGAAGMAAMQGGKPAAATAKPPVGGNPAAAGAAAPAQAANAAADPKDVEALNAMAAELENSQDPVDIELMKQYNGIINAINNRAATDKRTQGEIATSAAMGDAGL